MRSKSWRMEEKKGEEECRRLDRRLFAADAEMRVKRRVCKVEREREGGDRRLYSLYYREGGLPPAVAAAAAEIGCLTSV